MRGNSFRRFLVGIVGVAILAAVIIGEVLILKLTPIDDFNHQNDAEDTTYKKQHCSEIEPWKPYTLTFQQYACAVVFKNLLFFETYHDTINALSALFVAIFTFTLWRSTDKLWQASKLQSDDMRNSIAQAGRSASAMEDVAGSLQINATKIIESVNINKQIADRQRQQGEMQMRAYVCALIGGATYQERDKQLRFAARPALRNFGFTPAHKIKWRASAAVLPIPVPVDFKYPLPKEGEGSFLIPPQHAVEIFAVVSEFVQDSDVEEIKQRQGKALCVWGTVSYFDVFRKKRRMTFNHQMVWTIGADGKEYISGSYLPKHNRSS